LALISHYGNKVIRQCATCFGRWYFYGLGCLHEKEELRMVYMLKKKGSHLDGISDKTLHCLARILQDMERGTCDKCLYCKYAVECSDEFLKDRYILFADLVEEISFRTGVVTAPRDGKLSEELLKGSWVEGHPKLLEAFRAMPYERQTEMLTDLEIQCWADGQEEG